MPLTNEHILPKSLGGQHILEKASCRDCAKITARFEQDVAREMWGDARIAFNAPSRRRAKRPAYIYLSNPRAPHDRSLDLKIPYADYPAALIFYQMHRAGILQGVAEDVDVSKSWMLTSVFDQAKAKAFDEKHPGRLTIKFRHVPVSFGRLIAKVGYCQALTQLDPIDFNPICLPYILGSKTNISYVIGGRFDIPPPLNDLGYKLSTLAFGCAEDLLIVSEIRLFANLHTPVYHAVVGHVAGLDKVPKILEKLGPGRFEPRSSLTHSSASSSTEHWMPEVWPLPYWKAAR